MSEETHWEKYDTEMISVNDIQIVDRIVYPTKARIDAMAKSLSGPLGQIEPILITKHNFSSLKVVAGATRLLAAKQLGWKHIEATTIAADNSFEYQLIEIEENLGRHDLGAEERELLKAKRKEVQAARLKHLEEIVNHPAYTGRKPNTPPPEKAKGGRGKTGGIRGAAREAGVSKSTAHRHVKKKLSQTEKRDSLAKPAQAKQATSKADVSGEMFFHSNITPEAAAEMLSKQLSKAGYGADYMLTLAATLAQSATAQLAKTKKGAAVEVTPSTSNDVDVVKAENAFLKAKVAAKNHKALEMAVMQFDQLISFAARKRAREVTDLILEAARKKEKDDHDILKAARNLVTFRAGLLTKAKFNLIRSCLHTDSRKSTSDEKLNEAFRSFSLFEKLVEEPVFTTRIPLPETLAELHESKRKYDEERATKRAAAKAARENAAAQNEKRG